MCSSPLRERLLVTIDGRFLLAQHVVVKGLSLQALDKRIREAIHHANWPQIRLLWMAVYCVRDESKIAALGACVDAVRRIIHFIVTDFSLD